MSETYGVRGELPGVGTVWFRYRPSERSADWVEDAASANTFKKRNKAATFLHILKSHVPEAFAEVAGACVAKPAQVETHGPDIWMVTSTEKNGSIYALGFNADCSSYRWVDSERFKGPHKPEHMTGFRSEADARSALKKMRGSSLEELFTGRPRVGVSLFRGTAGEVK